MIKKIVFYIISFLVLFTVSSSVHVFIFNSMALNLSIPLVSVYLFHFVISLFICVGFALLEATHKWSHQLGFVYLFTFIGKLILFALFFNYTLFKKENLSLVEGVNLLIPLFLFLFLEVYFISKIISKKQY